MTSDNNDNDMSEINKTTENDNKTHGTVSNGFLFWHLIPGQLVVFSSKQGVGE
jgi:hypothetical protein